MGTKLATVSLLLLTLFKSSLSLSSSTPECPPSYNGSIAGKPCSREYSMCVNGIRQAATCDEDFVLYKDGCVPVEESLDCQPIDFDCNGLKNGDYAEGCSNVFYTCNNGVAFRRYCPQGTVFNPFQQACDYACAVPLIKTIESNTTCQDGEMTSFGMCSSRYNHCQNNTIRTKQCPVNTLFYFRVCLYNHPQCQSVSDPSNPAWRNQEVWRQTVFPDLLKVVDISDRAHLYDLLYEGGRRANIGKNLYEEDRKVEGNKRSIDDEFGGPITRVFKFFFIQRIFSNHRHSKFGATRGKRSAYYGSQQPGYGQQVTKIIDSQAQANKFCQQYTTPTFLTFGDCFDLYIYCSGNGVNRMDACPKGTTFNKGILACSKTCGVTNNVVTATVGTQTADNSTSSSTGIQDNTFTTQVPSSYDLH